MAKTRVEKRAEKILSEIKPSDINVLREYFLGSAVDQELAAIRNQMKEAAERVIAKHVNENTYRSAEAYTPKVSVDAGQGFVPPNRKSATRLRSQH